MHLLPLIRRTFGLLALVLAMSISFDALAATEDVVHMSDGRVLHGQIVKETDQSIVFDYLNQDLGITVTMTLPKAAILKIDRDVEVAGEPAAEETAAPAETVQPAEPSEEGVATRSRTVADSEGSSRFYIVEMSGQVGTDIRSSIYEDVIEEIKTEKPDVVIFKLDSAMLGDTMLDYWTGGNYDGDTYQDDPYKRQESTQQVMDDLQVLVQGFQFGLPSDIRQVVWVHDATGPAALLALAWPDMYMTPSADFGSLGEIWSYTQFPDLDVRSKMEKAWFGTAKGIMINGGHSDVFMEGILRPNERLSFSCVGRKPVWYLNLDGDIPIVPEGTGYGARIRFVVAPNGVVHGLEFDASVCEDLLISDGTAESLEDLALLLDERQYQVMETKVLQDVADYKEDWRERWDRCLQSFKDYMKYMERAGGDYALENLQKARKALARVIGAVRTNESVAVRFQSMTRLDLIQLEIMMEELKSQIRQMTRGGRGGGGRGGAGGVGGGPRP